jgi:ferredoxin-NADP reductase
VSHPADNHRQVLVAAHRPAAEGVVAIELVDVDGGALPEWTPGAHIDIFTDPDTSRQYSLCGRLDDDARYRVGVLREPASRGGSEYLHDRVRAGDLLTISAPRNHFELVAAPTYLFIAGGIGITPILSMIQQAERNAAEWQLLYGGRSRASMAFLDELAAYGDRVSVVPQDEAGLLDLVAAYAGIGPDVEVYSCGPEPLLDAVHRLHDGRPSSRLHVERFKPVPVGPQSAVELPFEVELARSGLTVLVPPGQTILECVRAAGVEADSSCEEGVCGECETRVLDGVPDHRDSVLSDDEQTAGKVMMICCSRARTERLVLDL